MDRRRSQAQSREEVKAHHGYPLNEEADIRSEMGRMKREQEKTWNTSTNRTIYQCTEDSKTKSGVSTTKQTTWTQAVLNRMRQKAGVIQAYRAFEKGTEKWRKENMPRKGKGNISAEGQELLEDKDTWGNETVLHGVIYESGNGKDPTTTVYSCHTRKDQSHPHSLTTGSSGRDRDENCWENG
jgi:hypothetical protein